MCHTGSWAHSERPHPGRTIEGLRGFTEDCLDNARERDILYGLGVWGKGEVKGTPLMKRACDMGRAV